jgi:hypothetical protein
VRNDLTPAQKAVQSSHCAFEAAKQLETVPEHPNFVLLSIKNETKLKKVKEEFDSDGFKTFPFIEPDLNDSMTAFAVGYVSGQDREKFKKYQLVI